MTHRLVFLFGLGLLAAGACSTSGGDTKVEPQVRGGRGESCQARNDCRDGLACVNNTCMQNDFAISPTAKQCDVIECEADEDCCSSGQLPSVCTTYQEQCAAGDTFYCDQYDAVCVCQYACDADNRCVVDDTCADDTDCGIGTCVGGSCVDCQTDDDCLNNFGPDYLCAGGECVQGCEKNEECGLLEMCDRGECVERPCESDRECIGATNSLLATCASGDCTVPCENDAECGNQQVCEGGACVFIGCETNEDCRHLLGVAYQEGVTAVCR